MPWYSVEVFYPFPKGDQWTTIAFFNYECEATAYVARHQGNGGGIMRVIPILIGEKSVDGLKVAPPGTGVERSVSS